jgi:two-component system sensor histidine kinase ChvG
LAIAERNFVRDTSTSSRDGDIVLGDDWIAPDNEAPDEMRARRERRGLLSLRSSPLTRKIITFNLIALNVLVAGILYLNSSRDSLAVQRASALVSESELIADVFEAQLPSNAPVNLATGDGVDVAATLSALDLRSGVEVYVYDTAETLISQTEGKMGSPSEVAEHTLLTDGLNWLWAKLSAPFGGPDDAEIPI